MKKTLLIFTLTISCLFLSPATSFAACDDGRIKCSHKCSDKDRPHCKDSKGVKDMPYCVSPGYCRDDKPKSRCGGDGWARREQKCSDAERNRGCQDKRNAKGKICVRFK